MRQKEGVQGKKAAINSSSRQKSRKKSTGCPGVKPAEAHSYAGVLKKISENVKTKEPDIIVPFFRKIGADEIL